MSLLPTQKKPTHIIGTHQREANTLIAQLKIKNIMNTGIYNCMRTCMAIWHDYMKYVLPYY